MYRKQLRVAIYESHPGRAGSRRVEQHLRRIGVGLGIVSALVAGRSSTAQTSPATPAFASAPARLSVRPHEMATGTQNPQAGEYPLDSLPFATNGVTPYLVYVPPQCVGARRCPLVVFLHGLGGASKTELDRQRPLADKYGMIFLVPQSVNSAWMPTPCKEDCLIDPDVPFLVREIRDTLIHSPNLRNMDAALKQVLRKFAIDPDRIAMAGISAGGTYSSLLGSSNADVFSRFIAISPGSALMGPGPRNTTTQLLTSLGTQEGAVYMWAALQDAKLARQFGYPVKEALTVIGHGANREEFEVMWRWLQQSWAASSPATPPESGAVPDSVVALTPKALARLGTFWDRVLLAADSDSVTTALTSYPKEVTVPVGQLRLSLTTTDIAALAATDPTVAATLKTAGLTASQQEAYWIAFLSARALYDLKTRLGTTGKYQTKFGITDGAAILGTIPATQEKNVKRMRAFLDKRPCGPGPRNGAWHGLFPKILCMERGNRPLPQTPGRPLLGQPWRSDG